MFELGTCLLGGLSGHGGGAGTVQMFKVKVGKLHTLPGQAPSRSLQSSFALPVCKGRNQGLVFLSRSWGCAISLGTYEVIVMVVCFLLCPLLPDWLL